MSTAGVSHAHARMFFGTTNKWFNSVGSCSGVVVFTTFMTGSLVLLFPSSVITPRASDGRDWAGSTEDVEAVD
jgi:hypothetical protein